ncbi:MAG: tetratricopeptide repeat protein, partial [Candidatus Bipolaricaulia bacterium]
MSVILRRLSRGVIIALALIVLAGCGGPSSMVDRATDEFVGKNFLEARAKTLEVLRQDQDNKDALALYGWSQFMLDNYQAAQGAFSRLEKLDPENFDALLGLGWTNLKLGNYDEAETYFKEAEDKAEDWQRYMVADGLGWLALRRGELEEAESFFKSEDNLIVDGQPLPADGKVGLGWLALKGNDPDAAKEHFAEGLSRDDKCFFCNDGLARVALLEGDLEEALKQTVAGLKKVQHNNGLLALFDTLLIRMNDPARSIEVLQELLSRKPEEAIFLVRLGWAQLAADRVKEAEESFRKTLKLVPGHASAQAGLGRIQFRKTAIVKEGWENYFKGKYEAALSAFEGKREEARAAGNPAAEDGRGWALLALGRAKEASEAFRAALKIDGGFFYSRSGLIAAQRASLTRYNRAWALANLGRFDEAEAAFERARGEVPEEFQWLIEDGLAWLAYYRKDYDRAESAFRAIVKKNPEAYLSRKGLGFVALERGDWEGALKALTASLVQNPYQVLTSYTIPALRFLEAKQFLKAKEVLSLGERAYPRSADLQFLLARAFKGLKDTESAAKRAVAAAALAPAYIHPRFDELKLEPAKVKDAYHAMGWGLYFAG